MPSGSCQTRSPFRPLAALRSAAPQAPPPRRAPSPAQAPAVTSALGKQKARHFRERRVGLFRLRAGVMAAFTGPAKPLLSLNPQEDTKFKKEVAQVRRRANKVSGRRGPGREGRRRKGSGGPARRASASPRLCFVRGHPVQAPTSRGRRPRFPREDREKTRLGRGP